MGYRHCFIVTNLKSNNNEQKKDQFKQRLIGRCKGNTVINYFSGPVYIQMNVYYSAPQPKPEPNPTEKEEDTPVSDYFKHLTPKCVKDNRVEAVEAEISAACKGTAEGLWRVLWNNENLGYVEVEHMEATTLYKDIETRFGKLPFKERQFRAARNKRFF